MTRRNHKPNNLSIVEIPQSSEERAEECKKAIFFGRKSQISLKRCDIVQQQSVDITCTFPIDWWNTRRRYMTSKRVQGHFKCYSNNLVRAI